jgi:hypothetical protein
MMKPMTLKSEASMSMQNEGKDARGRNYDQTTKDGSTSAGSYGAGATGDIGAGAGGNAQSGPTRTDDLLSDGTDVDTSEGFVAEQAGELQTGMAGIGSLSTGNAGSRQSAIDDKEEGSGGTAIPR